MAQDRRRGARIVAEFILIVVGVLAALAVDQWQASRGEREQAEQYLERLVVDLERTALEVRDVAQAYESILHHGRTTLQVLLGQAEIPNDTMSFLLSAYIPTRSFEPRVSRVTYDDLVSTGNLELIQPASLRDSIMDYYEWVELSLFPVDYGLDRSPYRAAVRSLIPLDLQLELQACGLFPEELGSCSPQAVGVSLTAVSRSILSEPQLARHLTLSMQSSALRTEGVGGTNDFGLVVEATTALRVAVEAALARH